MLLTTDRLIITEITTTDAAFYYSLLNSPSYIQNIGDRKINSVEIAATYIQEHVLSSYKKNGFGFYKILKKDTKETLGVCGFVKRAYLEAPDFGYAILPEFEGKGYTMEAAKAILEFGCNEWKLPKVLGITRPSNRPSRKLLEKLRFQQIGQTADPINNEALMLYQYKHTFK